MLPVEGKMVLLKMKRQKKEAKENRLRNGIRECRLTQQFVFFPNTLFEIRIQKHIFRSQDACKSLKLIHESWFTITEMDTEYPKSLPLL